MAVKKTEAEKEAEKEAEGSEGTNAEPAPVSSLVPDDDGNMVPGEADDK